MTAVLAAGTTAWAWTVGSPAAPAATTGAGAPAQEVAHIAQARAVATVARWAPGTGSLQFAVTQGGAFTDLTGKIAQAQAQALDFGLIGLSITAEGCDSDGDGQPDDPLVSPDQLPKGARVDNRSGDAEASDDEFNPDFLKNNATYGGGHEYAKATTQPLAQAIATTSASQLGPLVTIGAGRAKSSSQTTPEGVIEAVASVDATIQIAGVVGLDDMRWEGFHQTTPGQAATAEGGFSIGRITQAGLSAPLPEGGQAAEDAVNLALAPSGVRVEFPKVERLTDPADLLRVTPLRIVLEDSPAGAALLGPGLTLSREQRAALFEQIVAIDCRLASVLLVGDITLGVAAGTGFMAVEIGGVLVQSGEIEVSSPFGTGAGLPAVGAPDASGGPPGSVASPGAPGAPAAPSAPAAAPAVARGPLETICETVHPFGWPPCSQGAAVLLGGLGVAATVGMGALDWRYQDRRRRALATGATS